jgi:saccharopine dehydrogenase (NADP+, L-glutamate forming)/spermidine synthase
VILAGRNAAKYKENGELIDIKGEDLFDRHSPFPINGLEGSYESYPNRNSVPYIEVYNIPETKTMFRGTLRNAGWCDALKKVADSGFLDVKEREFPEGFTYRELTNSLLDVDTNENAKEAFMTRFELSESHDIVKRFDWMGLFSEDKLPRSKISPLDALCHQWEEHLQYSEGERDMLILVHEFEYDLPDGKEKLTSTMVDFGIPNGDSSMSRTVGLPAAIAVRMILEGKITDTGVMIPVKKSIYNPVLKELKEMGIAFSDEIEKI